MIGTIRAIIRVRRLDRLLKHLEKAALLAEKAGLKAKVAFDIERVMLFVADESIRVIDEVKEVNKGIAT